MSRTDSYIANEQRQVSKAESLRQLSPEQRSGERDFPG